MFTRTRVMYLVTGLSAMLWTIQASAITYPTEEDLRGIQSLCGAGSIQSVSLKGNVDAAIKNWKNASAGANLEVAKKNLAGFLDKVKDDANLDKSFKIYVDCTQNMVQKFLDAENKKPKPVSSRGVSDSLLRSAYATDDEMKRDGCQQARSSAISRIRADCPGTIIVVSESCSAQSSDSPRTYSASVDAECRPV